MSEEQGVCCALIQFNEVKEVEDLIRDLPNVCAKTKDFESKTHLDFVLGNDFDFNFERYKKVLDYYQAQPHLIDPHLPGLLELLGQLISKCPYEKSVSSKIPTKIILDFCPEIFYSFLGAFW
jgi:hypothetical protein